jgi:hypothetical protein
MCHPSEPFGDLDRALDELVQRGFNAIRACGMANWIYKPDGRRRRSVDLTNMSGTTGGGGFGRYVRWKNSVGGVRIDPLEMSLRFLGGCKQRGIYVVLTNLILEIAGEFSADPEIWDVLDRASPEGMWDQIENATALLLREIREHGLADVIAYVEIHNEQDIHRMAKVGNEADGPVARYNNHLERARDRYRREIPGLAVCGGHSGYQYWPEEMVRQSACQDVLHQHVYDFKGILHEYYKVLDCSWFKPCLSPWPCPEAAKVLRPDAVPVGQWLPPKGRLERIRLGVPQAECTRRMFYLMDWLEPQSFDYWLYGHYQEHALGMRDRIRTQIQALAREAARRGVPAATGEGWISYSPLLAEFEDGPVGKTIAEDAVRDCIENDYWAIVPNSNSSPAHARCWAERDWHLKVNDWILSGTLKKDRK